MTLFFQKHSELKQVFEIDLQGTLHAHLASRLCSYYQGLDAPLLGAKGLLCRNKTILNVGSTHTNLDLRKGCLNLEHTSSGMMPHASCATIYLCPGEVVLRYPAAGQSIQVGNAGVRTPAALLSHNPTEQKWDE